MNRIFRMMNGFWCLIDFNSILLLIPFFYFWTMIFYRTKNLRTKMNPVPSCTSCLIFSEENWIGDETPRLRCRSARGDKAAHCHSDWSDERREERNGGISLKIFFRQDEQDFQDDLIILTFFIFKYVLLLIFVLYYKIIFLDFALIKIFIFKWILFHPVYPV